ncbi:MAG: carbohydrate ABC transporter permease [Spirochaetia bacterium]|jgi:ABC-type glycerol-3-phosphate transport system permease component
MPRKAKEAVYLAPGEIAISTLILAVLALVFIVPFVWMTLSSLKVPAELFVVPMQWLPKKAQWHNYVRIFNEFPFLQDFRNTMVLVVLNVIGAVLSNTLIAYGFAKIEWKGREALFYVVLATLILPFQVVMIPLFILFHQLHWIGTLLPLIVPAFFGNAFFIFLLRQFYMSIPNELSYAAKMDGAGDFMIYRRVIIPLSTPAITTVIIFSFLRTWNDFIGPLIFLSDNKLYTLSLGAQQIMHILDPKWDMLLTLGVMMTFPVLIIFFVLQKYFIQGIAMTGIKG